MLVFMNTNISVSEKSSVTKSNVSQIANTRCDCNLRVILYVGKVSKHRKVLDFCSVFWRHSLIRRCHSLIRRCLQGAFKIQKVLTRLSIRLSGFFLKKIKKGQNKIRRSFTHAKGLALDLSCFWPLAPPHSPIGLVTGIYLKSERV